MDIAALGKVFVGDALIEAVVQREEINDDVLERAKEVKKAFDDQVLDQQQLVEVQLRLLKQERPPPPPAAASVANAIKPVVQTAMPMAMDSSTASTAVSTTPKTQTGSRTTMAVPISTTTPTPFPT